MADDKPTPKEAPPKQQVVHVVKDRTSGFAVASLVLGILSLLMGWIPAVGWIIIVLAIIFGIVGIVQTREKHVHGRAMAIAGIILAVVALIIIILFVGALLALIGAPAA